MCADFVYLASGSPRRRELLSQIGVAFQVLVATVDETLRANEAPQHYVARLARAKAEAGWRLKPTPAAPVLGADTAVILDNRILGKPVDRDHAAHMLLTLSGRTHAVLTAVALVDEAGVQVRLSRSEVIFREISAAEAEEYWHTGEAFDKAGGYAVQGRGAVFIAALHGSYSGVMGLPLYETAELLALAGVPRWR